MSNWDGNNILGAGRQGQYGAYQMTKAEAQAQMILQNAQLFNRVKPILEKCLQLRIQSQTAIKVLKPIQNLKTTISKSKESASSGFSGEMIPSGIELVYDGFELGQIFFKGFRNGNHVGDYSFFTGENIVVGNQQVSRNSGLIGLLTNTDIFTTVMELLEQRQPQ